MKGKIGNGSSLGRVCACVHVRAHILPALIFHFSFFLTTRKNFREPLHPSPGCTWRDTCAHSHTRACLCAHTHTHTQGPAVLQTVPRPGRKPGSGKPQAPPLAQNHVFCCCSFKGMKVGVGTVYVQKSKFCPKYPVHLGACPGGSSAKPRKAQGCTWGSLKIRSGHTPCWLSGALGKDQEVAGQRSLGCRLA